MRTKLFVIAAVASLVAGCASGPRDVVAESKDRAEGGTDTVTTVGTGGAGGGEECRAEQCWPVSADKDLSFVAVEVEGCGGDVDIWLEEGGERLDLEGAPHGQGRPCEGQPASPSADAIKFDGLNVGHDVHVCVAVEGSSSVGSVRIVSKAGRVCEEEVLVEGACEDCETPTTSATTGAGGGGGSGGEGGSDTTTAVTTGVGGGGGAGGDGTTTSVTTGGGGEGGASTTTTAATTSATTGGGEGGSGGEGGCGGSSGEGGAATETTTSASSGGGEGGACVHDVDPAVDEVL